MDRALAIDLISNYVSIIECDIIKLGYQNGNTAVSFGKTAL